MHQSFKLLSANAKREQMTALCIARLA